MCSNMKLLLSAKEIKDRIKVLASEISLHYTTDDLLILGVLKGSFIFFADLVREIDVGNTTIEFVSISSYRGTKRCEIKGEQIDSKIFDNKHVLIVEDIIDTGKTVSYLLKEIDKSVVSSVEIVSFLFKPEYYKLDYKVKWHGFEVDNIFVIGYGLDYKENFRNLKDLYILDEKGQ